MRAKSQHFDPHQSMNAKNFEVFHYKDANPQDGEMHHHDYYEVCCLLGGEVEYLVDGHTYRLNPGDLLLINPMELHRHILHNEETTYERIVLWINVDYLNNLLVDELSLASCFNKTLPTYTSILRPSAAKKAEIISLLGELVRESYSNNANAKISAYGIFMHFIAELNRLSLSENKKSEDEYESDLVSNVLAYIGDNYTNEITLDQLAQRFYVSKYHLSHLFTKEVGTSVYKYIMLKRLIAARQLISEGRSPAAACLESGYGNDYTSFYRAFVAEYGMSPGAYAKDKKR